jgi:hypothetical protein
MPDGFKFFVALAVLALAVVLSPFWIGAIQDARARRRAARAEQPVPPEQRSGPSLAVTCPQCGSGLILTEQLRVPAHTLGATGDARCPGSGIGAESIDYHLLGTSTIGVEAFFMRQQPGLTYEQAHRRANPMLQYIPEEGVRSGRGGG